MKLDISSPTEEEITNVHAALLEGCRAELAAACDPRVPDGVALVALLHGTPVAQIAFGTRREVALELSVIADEEGPAAIGLPGAGLDLVQRAPAAEGNLLCVVVALGRARIHEIAWPRAAAPGAEA